LLGLWATPTRACISACQALEGSPHLKLPAAGTASLRSLLSGSEPQVAAATLRAVGAHPEVDLTADLEAMVTNHAEPWLAAEALLALARRGAPSAASIASEWVADSELWRRKAAAAALPRLPEEVAAKLLPIVLAATEPAVRLAWLEALTPEDAKLQAVTLRQVVDADPDPAVRSQALELLRGAGQAGSVVELLENRSALGQVTRPATRAPPR
jgi:hypothetical protein